MAAQPARRRNAALVAAATFCLWSSLYIYVPVLPVQAQRLGASLPVVGLVVGAYGVAQLALRLPLGLLSDRLGSRRPFVLAGLAAASLGALVMGFAPTPWALAVGRAISGVSAASWVVFTVLFAASLGPGSSARAMSLITAITSLAQLGATAGGGALAQAVGYQWPFLAGALLAALGLLVVAPLSESAPPAKSRGAGLALGPPVLVLATLQGALLVGASQAAVYAYAPLYAESSFRAASFQIGLMAGAQFLGYTLGALAMPRLVAWLGARPAVVVGCAVAMVGLLAVPLAGGVWQMAALLAFHALGRGATYPLLMALSIAGVAEESRAGAMGLFQAGYSVGTVAAPPLAGLLADQQGLASVYLASAGACAVAALLALPTPFWRGAAIRLTPFARST